MKGVNFLLLGMFVSILLLPISTIGFVLSTPVQTSQSGGAAQAVVVGSDNAPAVIRALQLDQNSITLSTTDTIGEAVAISGTETIILVDTQMSAAEAAILHTFVSNGGGLFIFLGPQMTTNNSRLQELGVTTSNNLVAYSSKFGVVVAMLNTSHPLMTYDWASAPVTKNMTILPQVTANTTVLLANNTGGPGGAPILTDTTIGSGHILVFTSWITTSNVGSMSQTNNEFVLWPYFNYFIYSSTRYLSNKTVYTYAEWAYSPVPHQEQQIIIGAIVAAIAVLTVLSYRSMKIKSKKHIEILTEIERAELLVKTEERIDDWEDIGLHRQVGGFLIQLFITLLIVIPRVVLSIMIYPRFIMPFPTAAGWYSFSVNLFLGLWTVFDLGTSVALAKYFAEYRISQPEEAIKYAQIFVWFQCFTGVVQITLVAFIGSIVFPHTYLAHLSYVFIAHSLFQFPGFTLLFVHVFRGMNRIDYQQIVNILYYAVFNIVAPYIAILVFRIWGNQHPIFGEALGGAIGQAVGMYFTEWLTFGVSVYMFKKLGFKPGTLFRVDFGSEQIKKALKFGAKWALGASIVPIVWAYQMILVSTHLLNWSALQGQFQLAWDLAIMVSVVGLFMESMLGGISEAHSHMKQRLTELYTVEGLKWGAFFVFWLVSSLAAVGPRAILGAAGQDWAYAGVLFQFFLLFQIMGFWSWLGDWMFAGAERTGLAAAVWVLEQSIRAVAMTYFVITESVVFGIYLGGMPGIIVGYCIGLFAKNIVVWTLIRKYIAAPKFYLWQTYIGPAIAAIANFLILEVFARLIWGGVDDIGSSALLFFIGVFPSLYWYSFLSGLTGAWDKNTLQEFNRASSMVKTRGLGWLSRRFYGSVALGARVSPLHDRFPIDIYEEAMQEAKELTMEKKQLVI